MELRKLRKEEHIKTRKLWEEIFCEDTASFLDYYYTIKAAENEIYIMEDEGHICAMLHLNPYIMHIGGQSFPTHYIVAVATEEKYRHRGIMRELLKKALSDIKKNGEPFTFLMPAAEQIYYPHGFRYIYKQYQKKIEESVEKKRKWTVSYANEKDCEEIALFANGILERQHEVYVERNRHYYEVLLKEQRSEQGGILLLKENQKMIGIFPYAVGEEVEIREPLFLEKDEGSLSHVATYLDKGKQIKVLGYGDTEKPMIMAKILDVEKMFSCIKIKEEIYLKMQIWDTLTNASIGYFLLEGKEKIQAKRINATTDCVCIDVGELTSIVFGMEDIEKQDISLSAKEELAKIIPFTKVYLNEVV